MSTESSGASELGESSASISSSSSSSSSSSETYAATPPPPPPPAPPPPLPPSTPPDPRANGTSAAAGRAYAGLYDDGDSSASSPFADATHGIGGRIPYQLEMEHAFGMDFSDVNAHVGRSGEMRDLGARAAASGNTVAFASPSPSLELVAHEMTHVAQSRRSGTTAVQGKSDVGDAASAAEVEADQVADHVVAGRPFSVSAAPSASIHLDPDPNAAPAAAPAAGTADPANDNKDDKKDDKKVDPAVVAEINAAKDAVEAAKAGAAGIAAAISGAAAAAKAGDAPGLEAQGAAAAGAAAKAEGAVGEGKGAMNRITGAHPEATQDPAFAALKAAVTALEAALTAAGAGVSGIVAGKPNEPVVPAAPAAEPGTGEPGTPNAPAVASPPPAGASAPAAAAGPIIHGAITSAVSSAVAAITAAKKAEPKSEPRPDEAKKPDETETKEASAEAKVKLDSDGKPVVDASGKAVQESTDGDQKDKSSVAGTVHADQDGGEGTAGVNKHSEDKNAEGVTTTDDKGLKGDVKIDKDGKTDVAVDANASHSTNYDDKESGVSGGKSVDAKGGVHGSSDGSAGANASVETKTTLADKDTGSNSQTTKGEVSANVDKDGKVTGGVSGGQATEDVRKNDDGTTTDKKSIDGSVKITKDGSEVNASGATSHATDDGSGIKTDSSVEGKVGVVTTDKGTVISADGKAASGNEIKNEDGSGSSTHTSGEGSVTVGPNSGKGDASVSQTKSETRADGTSEGSSNTLKGGVDVNEKGEVNAQGSVDSKRESATKDKDTGESTATSDEVKVGVHVGDGGTGANASLERNRSTDDGKGDKESTTTKGSVAGGVDEKGNVIYDVNAAQSQSSETKGVDGRTSNDTSTTSGGIKKDKDGTTVSGGYEGKHTDTDGMGASEAAKAKADVSLTLDKDGNPIAKARGSAGREWDYKDPEAKEGEPALATNRQANVEGGVQLGKDGVKIDAGVNAGKSQSDGEGGSSSANAKLNAGAGTDAKGVSTVNVDGSVGAKEAYADKAAKVAGETERGGTGSVAVSSDGSAEVKGEITGKKTLADEDTGNASNTAHGGGGVAVDKDGHTTVTGTGGVESKQTIKNDDGSTDSKSNKVDASLNVKDDGSMAGKMGGSNTKEETHKDADGKDVGSATSTNVNVTGGRDADGTVRLGGGGGVSQTTTNADGSKETKGVDGSVELNAGPGKDGIKGQIGATSGSTKVAAGAGYQTTFTGPTSSSDKGPFTVSWTVVLSGSAAASGGKDTKGGGSVSRSETKFGSRQFSDKAQAQAFFDAAQVPAGDLPKTADAAAELPKGATIGVSTTGGVGVNAGTESGGVGLNGGAEAHGGSSVAVTAKGDGVVEVTAAKSQGESGSIGLTGGPAGANFGASEDHDKSTSVSFDLHTPEGKAAYEAYLKDPSKVPDKGAQVVKTVEHDQEGNNNKINLGPASMGESNTYDKTVVKDKDGKVIEEDQKGKTSSSVAVPILGHADESTSLNVKTDKDGNTTYAAKKTVDDSMASDANHALARATNTVEDKDVGGKTQGKFSVDTKYDQATMDEFAKKVEDGEYKKPLGNVGGDARDELKKALKEAGGDPEKRKEALAKFTEKGGDDALSQVKDATGKDGEHFVQLEGDKNLTGLPGRQALDAQIAGLDAKMQKTPIDPAMAGEIRGVLAAQQARQRAIANPANYPELPAGVRATETGRSAGDIAKLSALLATAEGAPKPAAAVPGAEPVANVPSGTDPNAVPAAGEKDKAPVDTDPAMAAARAKLQHMEGAMQGARAAMDAAYSTARMHNRVHAGNGATTASSPRAKYGDKDFGIIDNSETAAYAGADAAYAEGQAGLLQGEQQQGIYDATDRASAAAMDKAADAANGACGFFRTATKQFQTASTGYQGIADRHKSEEPGAFAGYGTPLKPGQ